MSAQHEYNGWTNYETWSVNLICTNEQSLDQEYRAVALAAATDEPDPELKRIRAADALKDWVTDTLLYDTFEHMTNDGDAGMLASQLLTGALSEVDWLEIADAALEP
jgi:hypothetical protein